ncbi:SusC/RagA family TonB-linked outer membrane protein [Gaoshiqia sp. Z1-71]|uniref:SusC/RagA family TonB-linked outer membrane protein n=1 Tax=Gaoshiqia hydrogeniformans TaxID=3290090 RepID=UPI003BF860F1
MKKKLLYLLVLFVSVLFDSHAQNNRLTAHLSQVRLSQVFELIQQQTEFIIFYNDDQVDLDKKVSIDAEDLPVEQVLNQALKGLGLDYKIFDRQIIIIEDRKNSPSTNNRQPPADLLAEKRIEGKVTDENGNPLFGASVFVKNTNIGVTTDPQGYYALNLPPHITVLDYSYIGMKRVEVNLEGMSEINVTLVPDDFGVEEIIVSALGIPREEKSLTYATQTLSSDEIANNRDFSFVTSLSGKISGIEITKSAAGAGGSSKVLLRGNKSLNSSSAPLFVIDGIPMANYKSGQIGLFGGTDQGDGLSQINADDIESITILKGANAAALYGSQGANGVILVTTKKGEEGPLKINLSSGLSFESIQKTPDLQFNYGSVDGAKESWSYTKGNYPRNYVRDFFRTGKNLTNTISISGGGKSSTAYFLASNTSFSGVIPENRYQKTNLTFRQSIKLLDERMDLGSNIMLTNEVTENKNIAGYYLNPLTGLYLFPRERSFAGYAKDYQVFNTDRNMYLQNWFVNDHFQSNPYWIIHNEKKEDLTKRLIGSLFVNYNFSPRLKLKLRGNYDYAVRLYEEKHKAGSNLTNAHENGRWKYEKVSDELIYADAILTHHTQLGKISLNSVLGTSYQKSTFGLGISVDTNTDGLKYPNEFSFQNIADNVLVNSVLGSRIIKEAIFGNIQIGFSEKIFLDLSGRNDWASSLYGTGNESYFYPSAGISGLISELFNLPGFINFGKIRTSFSMVGNEVPFNSVSPNHTITKTGVEFNTVMPFSNLKPEMIRSFEIGTNWKLFRGSIGFDFTYYQISSRDQFISLPALSGSGYTSYYVNVGEITNSGVELSFTAKPIHTQNFNWLSVVNFSDNRNRIVSLHPDLTNPIVLSDVEGYQLIIKEGGSFGDMYVHKFLRDDQGRIKLNANGTIPKSEEKEYIGNSNPRWSMGLTNRFRYKNLSFEFLINGKFGGKVISQTEAMLDGYGVSRRSAIARDQGGVSINAVLPDGTAVTQMDTKLYYTSIGDRDGIKEPYTYSRSNIRLSQLALSYQCPLSNIWIKQVDFSFVAQNLFFLYKDAPFDPEITLNTLIKDQAIDIFTNPPTRTLGFSVKIQF